MTPRSFRRDTGRNAHGGLTIATIAVEPEAMASMQASLEQLDTCRLMAYQRPERLFASIPVEPVDLLVFGPDVSEESLTRIMNWSRRHWPRCLSVVLGRPGDLKQERTARQHGAMFFAASMPKAQWQAVLDGAAASRTVRIKTA